MIRLESRSFVAFHELIEVHTRVLTNDRKLARLVTLHDAHGRIQNRIVYLRRKSQVEFAQMLQLSDRLDYSFKTKQNETKTNK